MIKLQFEKAVLGRGRWSTKCRTKLLDSLASVYM